MNSPLFLNILIVFASFEIYALKWVSRSWVIEVNASDFLPFRTTGAVKIALKGLWKHKSSL